MPLLRSWNPGPRINSMIFLKKEKEKKEEGRRRSQPFSELRATPNLERRESD